MEEAEARAQSLAMLLDRLPDLRVLGVVVHHQHLVVRVIQGGKGIEGLDQQLGRLVVSRHVDGDEGQLVVGHLAQWEGSPPFDQPQGFRPLVRLRDQEQHDADAAKQEHESHGDRGQGHVLAGVLVDDPHRRGRDQVGHQREKALAARTQGRAVAKDQGQDDDGEDEGQSRQLTPLRYPDHGFRERELGLALGVVDAPIGADRALDLALPRLIERLHDVVDVAGTLRHVEEAAQELGLVVQRGLGALALAPIARPANLGNDDRHSRIGLLELLVAHDHIVHRLVDRNTLPIGQEVHSNEIDLLDELGMREPNVPRLGGADGGPDLALDALDVVDELVDREVFA